MYSPTASSTSSLPPQASSQRLRPEIGVSNSGQAPPSEAMSSRVGRRSTSEQAFGTVVPGRDLGPRHDQRHPGRALEERHLEEHPPVAQHVAVVAGDDDHGVVQGGRSRPAHRPGGPARSRNNWWRRSTRGGRCGSGPPYSRRCRPGCRGGCAGCGGRPPRRGWDRAGRCRRGRRGSTTRDGPHRGRGDG